jgi:outer membrane receptor for ferrienterochelin and colicins
MNNNYLKSFIFLLFVQHVFAEEAFQSTYVETIYDDQDIIVLSTLEEEQLKDTAVKTEVIGKDFIKKNNLKSMTEVIERLPGVILEENTGRSGASAVMQGLGQDQVLVMIDGVPQMQTTSSGFDLTQLNTDEIEKIEVIKGGSSALYGSHAIGGVINILTNKGNTKKFKVTLDALLGNSSDQEEPNSYVAAALSTPVTSKSSLKVNVSRNDKSSTDLDARSLNRDGSDSETINGKALFRYVFNRDSHAFLQYRYNQQKTLNIDSVRTVSGGFSRRDNFGEVKGETYVAGGKVSFGNSSIRLNTQYEDTSEVLDLLNDPSDTNKFTIVEAEQVGLRSELVYEKIIGDFGSVSVGAVIQNETLKQVSRDGISTGVVTETVSIDDKKRNTVDVYTQSEIFIGDNIEIAPGVRFQKDSRFSSNVSPKINTKFSLKEKFGFLPSFRFSVGTGYRTPSLKENYYVLDHRSIGNYIVTGNENLVPEESVSYQAGMELSKGKAVSLYSNLFLNKLENMIDRVEAAPQGGSRQFQMVNFDKVETRGVELSAKIRAIDRISLGVDYSYTESINERTGLQLPNRPKSVFNLNASYDFTDNLDMVANYRFLGDQFVDTSNTLVSSNYTTFDMKMNYKVSRTFKLYWGMNNVFNVTREGLPDGVTQDEEIRDARPVVGRYAYLGVSFEN